MSDVTYQGIPGVRIPYYDVAGNESGAVRIRKQLQKSADYDDRFVWKQGSKLCLYGLNRKYSDAYCILCEGESDCHTLWYHGFPALGVPGASNWKEERDAYHLNGIKTIYVIIEPDQGGEATRKWLVSSHIRTKAKLIFLHEHKDPSELYLDDPQHFKEQFQAEMDRAESWTDLESAKLKRILNSVWSQCSTKLLPIGSGNHSCKLLHRSPAG